MKYPLKNTYVGKNTSPNFVPGQWYECVIDSGNFSKGCIYLCCRDMDVSPGEKTKTYLVTNNGGCHPVATTLAEFKEA